jgi:hypothetical protein
MFLYRYSAAQRKVAESSTLTSTMDIELSDARGERDAATVGFDTAFHFTLFCSQRVGYHLPLHVILQS